MASLLYIPTEARELGQLIFAANPYLAGMPPKDTWVNPPLTVVLVTTGGDPPYYLDPKGTELAESPGHWEFKYAQHYVARAIRVPYMYYKRSDADPLVGLLVRDYFLIGFEGGAVYKRAKD